MSSNIELYKSEREEYICRLENQINAIDKIVQMEYNTLINEDIIHQLTASKKNSEILLHKLKSNEYEIAIVGLEKAGKSTFANALMENEILPTDDQRCTYTATRIEYSSNDHAIVSFYSKEEFNKDFKDKLNKIGIINAEKYSYDTMNKGTYLSLYEDVNEEKKRLYEDSLHQDIIDILDNYNSLDDLLGQMPKAFSSDDINSKKLESFITSPDKAIAVKEVVIYSSKLENMKEAVIYDVPGFNSPTALHHEQTLDKMKSADAIIIVAKGDEPSITGDVLKIFKESDGDGTQLKDKLFVFANKSDRATNIIKNMEVTYEEWINRRHILTDKERERIIFGSALSHLKHDTNSVSKLPNGDGIDFMRESLENYNRYERFDVLKRRVNRIWDDVLKVFSELRSKHSDVSSFNMSYDEYAQEIALFKDEFIEGATSELKKYKQEIRNETRMKKPLSETLINYIKENITADKFGVTDELIDEISKSTTSTTPYEDTQTVEGEIRKKKFREMYNDFSDNVINIATNGHENCMNRIIDIFINLLKIDKNSSDYDEVYNSLNEELSKYHNNTGYGYYQCLVERFSRDIYEILIGCRYGEERLKKFYGEIDNFYSLSVFYRSNSDSEKIDYINIPPKEQPLCMMLLFHDYQKKKESIEKIIKEISGLAELSVDILQKAYNAFGFINGDMSVLQGLIESSLKQICQSDNDDEKKKTLDQRLEDTLSKSDIFDISNEKEFTKKYLDFHTKDRLSNYEDIKIDFTEDINILQDVLKNAFVSAVSMEKPFIAKESKSIEDILEYIKTPDFTKFIVKISRIVMADKRNDIDRKDRERRQNEAILAEIDRILNLQNDLNTEKIDLR